MESTLKLNPSSQINSPPCKKKIPSIGNGGNDVGSIFLLPMRNLNSFRVNRFNLDYNNKRKIIQNPNLLLQIKPVSLVRTSTMAEEAEMREKHTVEEREKERPPPPPPPEKPEPGDCCGSGCVRCVWDVYYDELEAYNQLLKEFSSQSPPSQK